MNKGIWSALWSRQTRLQSQFYLLFYPPERKPSSSKDDDDLCGQLTPPMNGSEEAAGRPGGGGGGHKRQQQTTTTTNNQSTPSERANMVHYSRQTSFGYQDDTSDNDDMQRVNQCNACVASFARIYGWTTTLSANQPPRPLLPPKPLRQSHAAPDRAHLWQITRGRAT